MQKLKDSEITQEAKYICDEYEIDPAKTDLILFMGETEARNNLDTLKNWIAEQEDLFGWDEERRRNKLSMRFAEYVEDAIDGIMNNGQGGLH